MMLAEVVVEGRGQKVLGKSKPEVPVAAAGKCNSVLRILDKVTASSPWAKVVAHTEGHIDSHHNQRQDKVSIEHHQRVLRLRC